MVQGNGDIGGDPLTLISSFIYTVFSANGTSFGPPGFFKLSDGYLIRPYNHIYTMFSDKNPHSGETQLIEVQWNF